jgi:hypothetical protein
MTDFVQAALNGCQAKLANGDVVNVHFNPAGKNGWVEDILVGFDNHDNGLAWSVEGMSLDGDLDYDIMQIVKNYIQRN